MAGLAKLRNRVYHKLPLSKPIGGGLFELRHVGKLNTRLLYFLLRVKELSQSMGYAIRQERFPNRISKLPWKEKRIGWQGRNDEKKN
jgi:hypothetical protein